MVSATTAAPCSLDQRHHPGVAGVRAVAVLEVDRVDDRRGRRAISRPASITARLGGVEHQRQGGGGGEPAGHLAHVVGAVPADVVDVQSRAGARRPGSGSRAISTHSCQSPASIASRNALEPLALVRSPIISTEASCRNGTRGVERGHRRLGPPAGGAAGRSPADPLGDLADVLGRGAAAAADQAGAELGDEARRARRPAPAGSAGTPRRSGRARAGRRSASPTRRSGRAGTGSAGARSSRPGRWRSSGRSGRCPAAPARSAPRRSREPSSMVPVVSTVTWAMIGSCRPAVGHRPLGAEDRRPWPAAGPGRSRPAARPRRPRSGRRPPASRRRAAWRTCTWPSVGSLVPGPIEPSTKRGRSGGGVPVGRPRGRSGRRPRTARGSGRRCRTRRGWPSWRRRCWSRPRRRRPRSRRRGRRRTTSGRVTFRISLQPSRPSKSSRVRSAACSMVPIAPSATRTRSVRAVRNGRSSRGPEALLAGYRRPATALDAAGRDGAAAVRPRPATPAVSADAAATSAARRRPKLVR